MMGNEGREEEKHEEKLATQVTQWSYETYTDDEESENPQNLAPPLIVRDVAEAVMIALNDEAKAVRNARILVLGVSAKRDSGDLSGSPAPEVIERLLRLGGQVSY